MRAIDTFHELVGILRVLDHMETLRLEATYTDGLSVLTQHFGEARVKKALAAQKSELEQLEASYQDEQELRAYLDSPVCQERVLAQLHSMGYRSYQYDKLPARELFRIIREKRIPCRVNIVFGREIQTFKVMVYGPESAAEQQARDIAEKVYPGQKVVGFGLELDHERN